MRGLFALALLLGACSGFDDFGPFRFDGGVATDGPGMDLTNSSPFGAACTANSCMQYNLSRPVSCVTMMAGTNFPGGMCTRPCIPGAAACTDYPDAVCEQLNGVDYCLPRCVGGGPACRPGYDCCINNGKVSPGEQGACAPADSNLCH